MAIAGKSGGGIFICVIGLVIRSEIVEGNQVFKVGSSRSWGFGLSASCEM